MSSPADFNTDGVVGEYSAGPLTAETNPNFAQPPDLFPSNRAFVPPHGCAGTKSNVAAAQGIFEPYSKMKGGMTKLSTHSGDSGTADVPVPGPASGHREVAKYDAGAVRSDTAHAKQVAGKRRSRKVSSKKSRGRRSRSHRGRARRTRRSRKHMKRSRKARTRHHNKRRGRKHTRRVRRGGAAQPFSNQPISFGYGINAKHLSPSESALANPAPIEAYDTCAKVPRN